MYKNLIENAKIIRSLTEFVSWCEDLSQNGGVYIFRGQSNSIWPLMPKADRSPYCSKNADRRFEVWEKRATMWLDLGLSKHQKICIAQHHGLATKLLDWSFNPLVALYFSISEKNKDEKLPDSGIVYRLNITRPKIKTKDIDLQDQDVDMFLVRGSGPNFRLANQAGVFTFDPKNDIHYSLNYRDKSKFDIDAVIIENKNEIELSLLRSGIHHMSLFPDLYGIAEHIDRIETRSWLRGQWTDSDDAEFHETWGE